MKKIITLALAFVMVFSMVACGNNDEPQEEGGETAGGGAITVISREEGSGTRSAFTELMGILVDDVDNTTQSAEISQSTSVVMTTVAGNASAIGYISLGSLDDSVKAVKVDGVEATVDNVKSGDYAVSRPFLVVTKDGLSEVAQDFIDFIMSADGQQIIGDEGYISIDDAAAAYEEKSGMSGRIVLAGSTSVSPVMQVLADAYKAIYPDVEIEIQQTGSGAGITSTIEGACDIGMSSRALEDSEIAEGIEGTTIALDGIAVIVNQENAVADLTSEQIRQIFTGEITDWADVQ